MAATSLTGNVGPMRPGQHHAAGRSGAGHLAQSAPIHFRLIVRTYAAVLVVDDEVGIRELLSNPCEKAIRFALPKTLQKRRVRTARDPIRIARHLMPDTTASRSQGVGDAGCLSGRGQKTFHVL